MEGSKGTHLLAVHLPESLWDAMSALKKKTGRNRSDQAREAFMQYFGISDLSQPFKLADKAEAGNCSESNV
jgi:hypothetical protein